MLILVLPQARNRLEGNFKILIPSRADENETANAFGRVRRPVTTHRQER